MNEPCEHSHSGVWDWAVAQRSDLITTVLAPQLVIEHIITIEVHANDSKKILNVKIDSPHNKQAFLIKISSKGVENINID